jgi:hypothetical protein
MSYHNDKAETEIAFSFAFWDIINIELEIYF